MKLFHLSNWRRLPLALALTLAITANSAMGQWRPRGGGGKRTSHDCAHSRTHDRKLEGGLYYPPALL
jgi:hypothetical protein